MSTKPSKEAQAFVAAVVMLIVLGAGLWAANSTTDSQALYQQPAEDPADQEVCIQSDLDKAAPISCTIITASQGDTVLYGNNEDWINPETYYWIRPGSDQQYGAIYFGFDDFYPQGGINEKGLAYDWNALPEMALNPHPELQGALDKVGAYILERAATVEEAIELLRGFSWGSYLGAQMHLADATGAAAVMSAGADGELAFTRKEPGDGFLISTNFNLAYPESGGRPCWRYDTATTMLEQVFDGSVLDVEQLRAVLDAAHQEGLSVNTVYSNIFDLRRGVIYLYHWYQFGEVVVLDVDEELAGEASTRPIRSLFSQSTLDEAAEAHQRYLDMPERWRSVGRIYLAGTAVSLVVMLWCLARMPSLSWRMRLTWILAVIFLGVFGLLAFMLSNRLGRRASGAQAPESGWRLALAGTAYSLVGYGVVWLLTLAYLILYVDEVAPGQVLGFTFGVPLVVGWLLFRTPLAALHRGGSYWEALRWSFLPEFISLNFACIGFFPTVLLPANRFFMSPPSFVDPLLWFLLMMGVLAGFFTLFPLNAWMAYRRGAREAVQTSHSGEPTGVAGDQLTFRRAWYLVLLSFALYVGSVMLTIMNM